jgi:hypothetical protein
MPFIACSSIFVQNPFPIGKVVNIVLYTLVHGIRPKLMFIFYNAGVSIV